MMSLFSIPVVEKSGVSVACFKIIKLFFLIWLLLRFLPLVFTVTFQIIIYLYHWPGTAFAHSSTFIIDARVYATAAVRANSRSGLRESKPCHYFS